jgi:hypothetical protein
MTQMSRQVKLATRIAIMSVTLLTTVAMPFAFAGVGFCRSMPCCPSHAAGNSTSVHWPDCCGTSSCDEPPAAASEYVSATRIHSQSLLIALIPMAIPPNACAMAPAITIPDVSPPPSPPALQRRIAALSTLLI